MKKILLIVAVVFMVASFGMIALNSAKNPSKNMEGIVELTGPVTLDSTAKKGGSTVTTMGFQLPVNNEDNKK